MNLTLSSWQVWALLSALFAALTAIFAKIGVEQDLATFIRTIVVIVLLAGILAATGGLQNPAEIPARSWVFLVLSGLATGASWLCYFRPLKIGQAARVAPVDKLSVVLVAIFGVVFLGEKLATLHWIGVALIASGAVLLAIP